MRGNIIDALGTDIDCAAVAHAFELFFAAYEHVGVSLLCTD
jgi:hypothetical protein